MNKLLLLIPLLVLLPFSSSFWYEPVRASTTYLKIVNYAGLDIIATVVTDTDPYDWADMRGPSLNFQDLQIPAGMSVNKQEKLNDDSMSALFTMTLVFADGTREKFRAQQTFGTNKRLVQLEGRRNITASKDTTIYLYDTVVFIIQ
ncbi:hypothetical protein Zmor_005004 [Zophobas morio]|uniref:Uncharacterized protein n=1 Tax=Zophobas morio TaxID=2755281 RepID=A0AA38MLW8_9CUCU|nr:hypothetical protein Zmor_005004 [Zophobas morio]